MSPAWLIAVVALAVPIDDPEIDWCPCCGLYPVPDGGWRCVICHTDNVPHPMEA